ncbi:MAG: hypothetical protein IIA85_00675 [Nanoarchaeota archaeon]|nr:hypothetical protein [Nanoarchaeota archaeon]
MNYQKYLIVASKKDKAGINITTHLSQFQNSGKFDFYLVEEDILFTENLDLEKINKYDFIIFASRHKSSKEERSLTVHSVGNFRIAEFGGENGKLCKSSALFQKQLFEKLQSNVKKYNLKNYDVSLEATHHGPLIDKPCVFIEIGSTEIEYKDRRAGFVIAKTISETIENFKENPYNEVVIAIGGKHYCQNFNKIQLNSNVAISHVISQYVFPLTKEMVKEAIEKTDEEIDFALLDWKGLGNSEKRNKILEILDKLYVSYKKTSNINKG